MKKIINIGAEAVTFQTSAYLPILYREITGREFFKDIEKMESDVSGSGFYMAFAMYRHGGGDKNFMDFLASYEMMDLINAIPELTQMLLSETKTQSEAKKNKGR